MAPTPHLCVNYYLCIQVPTYVPFVRDGPVGSLEKDLSSPQTASHPHQPPWHLAGCAIFSAAPLLRCISLLRGRYKLELWNRILKSRIKSDLKSRIKSDLSDFLTGRKPLLLWSF